MKQIEIPCFEIMVNGKLLVFVYEKEYAENIAKANGGTVKESTCKRWITNKEYKKCFR